jgi:hypothetical protein
MGKGKFRYSSQSCKAGDGIAGPRSPGDTIAGFMGACENGAEFAAIWQNRGRLWKLMK